MQGQQVELRPHKRHCAGLDFKLFGLIEKVSSSSMRGFFLSHSRCHSPEETGQQTYAQGVPAKWCHIENSLQMPGESAENNVASTNQSQAVFSRKALMAVLL